MPTSFPLRCVQRLTLGLLAGGVCSCLPGLRRPSLPLYKTEKFRLSAGPAAADDYPATIDKGRFITSSGGGFPLPYGHFLEGS